MPSKRIVGDDDSIVRRLIQLTLPAPALEVHCFSHGRNGFTVSRLL